MEEHVSFSTFYHRSTGDHATFQKDKNITDSSCMDAAEKMNLTLPIDRHSSTTTIITSPTKSRNDVPNIEW